MTRKLLIAALCLTCAGAALAQPAGAKKPDEKLVPPVPTQVDKPNVVVFYLLIIVIAGVGIGAMLIPPRRGHQD